MALSSMTGFGSASKASSGLRYDVEAKSVNHRYLDIVFRLPASLQKYENELAQAVRDQLRRGRVEISVSRAEEKEKQAQVELNNEVFLSYLAIYKDAYKLAKTDHQNSISDVVNSILERKDVIVAKATSDTASEVELMKKSIFEAVEALLKMRKSEGKRLEVELVKLLKILEAGIKTITSLSKKTVKNHQAKLIERIKSLNVQVEPERIAQEVALAADRLDISEEIVRFNSHCLEFRKIIKEDGGGRKLEFVLQELFREINTIGSKAQNSEITTIVIDCKATIEKLREQVQNIE